MNANTRNTLAVVCFIVAAFIIGLTVSYFSYAPSPDAGLAPGAFFSVLMLNSIGLWLSQRVVLQPVLLPVPVRSTGRRRG